MAARALFLLAASVVALAVPVAADAAFPGRNGLIAFQKSSVKEQSDDIYVIGPNGGMERDVTHTRRVGEYSPTFSPNGRTIVFLWGGPGIAGNPVEPGGIGIVNSDGSGYRHLTSGNINTDPVSLPTWTADGKSIIFERQRPVPDVIAPTTIWSISSKGGAAHQITTGSDFFALASPRGGELAFDHGDADGNNTVLETTNLSGGNPTVIGGPLQISDWSPDARRFVYSGPHLAIWTVPLAGGTATQIADLAARDEDPAFSPDGRLVVWTNERTHDLWVVPSGGGKPRNLTHQPGFEKDPTWGRAVGLAHKKH